MGRQEVLQSCIDYFWGRKKGNSFGPKDDNYFMLGDFKHEIISDMIKDVGGEDIPFTIGNYCEANKMARPRIYLLTKSKSVLAKVKNIASIFVNSDDDDFELDSGNYEIDSFHTASRLTLPDFSYQVNDLPAFNHNELDSTISQSMNHTPPATSTPLLGSSAEREVIRQEVDNAFQRSLELDTEKSKSIENDVNEELRLTELMNARKSKLQDEPTIFDDHVTVTVRHTILGNKIRFFNTNAKMTQIYDWIGSLNQKPEYFELLDFNGLCVSPDLSVTSGVFNMRETDVPTFMSMEGEVAFKGYGVKDVSVGNELPGDNSLVSYKNLTAYRNESLLALNEEISCSLNRENIYDEMIKFYGINNAHLYKINISFSDEEAVGEGVTRDAFSSFLHHMYGKFDGCHAKVPVSTMDEAELETIGKIITQAFLLSETFPVQICKSSLKYALFGAINDDELLHSFFEYIPSREKDFIIKFSEKQVTDTQAIIDILFEHKVFENPTPENVFKLCLKAANSALIRLPYFAMKSLLKGMGSFWKDVSIAMFDSIYKCTIPTAEKIISCLDIAEVLAQDSKITTWLHRYLRSSSEAELLSFIRFVTGSTSLPPEVVIKVEFINQPPKWLRPMSATCFKILQLPRQYSSFSMFRHNLKMHTYDEKLWQLHDHIIG